MRISNEEYKIKENAWIKEQYLIEEIKPSGMCGNWSYRLKKEREFAELMKEQGIEKNENF